MEYKRDFLDLLIDNSLKNLIWLSQKYGQYVCLRYCIIIGDCRTLQCGVNKKWKYNESKLDCVNTKSEFLWIEKLMLCLILGDKEKKEEIWLSPMTKAPTPTEKLKKQRDNSETPPKSSITQRLRTDLGRSVGVTN